MYKQNDIYDALNKGLTAVQKNKLHNAHVAVAGLGGIGSNTAVWLTRIGIGHLYLYDFDKVELSNLNRQYYFLSDIGIYKTTAITKHLQQINPYTKLYPKVVRLTQRNIPLYLERANIICEALDKAETKAMLVNTILSLYPEKTIIAANGIAGFGKAEQLVSKHISKNLYLCGDNKSDCQTMPLCGARIAICAAQQALLTIRIILGIED